MSRFQPSDKLMIKTNALQLAMNTGPDSPGGSPKLTADELVAAAKKIEAYLMEAEVEEQKS